MRGEWSAFGFRAAVEALTRRNPCPRQAGCVAALFAALSACSTATQTSPSGAVPPMSMEQYATVRHEWPHVVHACLGAGVLHYVGVEHTRDPSSASVRSIVQNLATYGTDVVFVEGPTFEAKATLDASVGVFGEAGALLFVAREQGLPVRSLDQPFSEEAAGAAERYGRDRAAAFYGLRIVAQERSRDPTIDVDLLIDEKVVPWLQRNGLLVQIESSGQQFRSIATRHAPGRLDWSNVPRSWFDPLGHTGAGMNEIARFLVSDRDRRFARVLVDAVRRGQRVMASAGVSHVVMQEPAILSGLGCPRPTLSQPAIVPSPSVHSCDQHCTIER